MAVYSIKFNDSTLEGVTGWTEDINSRVNESVIPRMDGSKISGNPSLESRMINIKGVLVASSVDDIRTKLNVLSRIINSGLKSLQLHDDRYIYAAKKSFSYEYSRDGKLVEYEIDFICPDPYYYSLEETTVTGDVTSGDNKTISVTVGGNIYTPFALYVSPSSDMTYLYVYNSNVDKYFEYEATDDDGTIYSGTVIEIDTGKNLCACSGNNVASYFSGVFFKLEGNTSNTFYVSTDADINYSILFYDRWV